MRQSVCKDGETAYHQYVLLYVDDCVVISDRAEYVIRNEMGKYFCGNEESTGGPIQYLGGNMREAELENKAKAWSFVSK